MSSNKVLNKIKSAFTAIMRRFFCAFYFLNLGLINSRLYNVIEAKMSRILWFFRLKMDVYNSYFGFKVLNRVTLRFFQLSLLISFIFLTPSIYDKSIANLDAQTLPNCDELPSGTAPNSGVNCIMRDCASVARGEATGNNCLYRGLPLCSALPSTTAAQHRINCFDVVDLPLCNHIPATSDRDPLRNCVRLCSDADFSSTPGGAVFAQNCIRFCDDMPTGMTAIPTGTGRNCVQRLCHQLPVTQAPQPSGASRNCTMARCDGLWPKEHERLYNPNFYSHQYCDGNVKCFNLKQDLLQYVNLSLTPSNRRICQVHSCPPESRSNTHNCGRTDEYAYVLTKSSAFRRLYDSHVSDIQDASETGYQSGDPQYGLFCEPLQRCPLSSIVRQQKMCTDTSGSYTALPVSRTVPDPDCGPSVYDRDCQGTDTANGQQPGFCFQQIDCSVQTSNPLCPPPPGTTPATPVSLNVGTVVDRFDSWFHRPTPAGKALARTTVVNGKSFKLVRGTSGGVDLPPETFSQSLSNPLFSSSVSTSVTPTAHSDDGMIDTGLCVPNNWRNLYAVAGRHHWVIPGFLGIPDIHFYSHNIWDPSISPRVCLGVDEGHRGTGYIYLKGSHGLLYNTLDDDVIYQKGEVFSDFDNNLGTHTAQFCLRFANTLCTQCGGQRECVPTATIDGAWTQVCGRDVCRTFVIAENPVDSSVDPQSCMMTQSASAQNNNLPGSCSSVIDTYLRMRTVYYTSQDTQGGMRGVICGYLDAKGHLGYNPTLFGADRGGSEIGDGYTCVNDKVNNLASGCSGYDSASNPGLATIWRNVKKATYIGNNQPLHNAQKADGGSRRGYYDRSGKFHEEQFCARTAMRSGSPLLYNLANMHNSPTMFTPPMVILRVNSVYGGTASTETDFSRPEVLVQFGSNPITTFSDGDPAPTSSCFGTVNTANCPRATTLTGHNQTFLSLAPGELTGYSGTDASPGGNGTDSPAYAKLYSEIPGVASRLLTEVYLEKDYNASLGVGTVCVYQRTRDGNDNVSPNPLKVGCVNRRKSIYYIHWNIQNTSRGTVGLRMPVPPRNFPSGSLMTSSPAVNVPSSFVNINVSGYDTDFCTMSVENYRFCVRRGFCTQLARECSDANAVRSNKIILGQSTVAEDRIIARCQNTVLPQCLRMRGLPEDGTIFDILRTNNYGAYRCRNSESLYLEGADSVGMSSQQVLPSCLAGQTPFLYGWHNDYEISVGHENFLRKVLAHKIPDGRMGICKIDPTSPYLTDTTQNTIYTTGMAVIAIVTNVPNTATNCLGGGDDINCRCTFVPDDFTAYDHDKFYVRDATPREIRLTRSIPIRRVCRAFVGSSQTPPVGENFNMTNTGSRAVGTCDTQNGWVNATVNNLDALPQMSCIEDTSPGADPNEGVWSLTGVTGTSPSGGTTVLVPGISNRCVRRTCNILYAGSPNIQGDYRGSYDASETGECRGARNGFANWPTFRPSSLPSAQQFIANADSCITGFKPFGSTATTNTQGNITGYSGGTLPRRVCNITGQYGAVTRESVDLTDTACDSTRDVLPTSTPGTSTSVSRSEGCVRISCPAINPPTPTSITDAPAWNAWFASSGASFPGVNASRSSTSILSGSTSTGTCNNSLGFFSAPSAPAPTRTCDHLGNWGPVVNPCITLSCGGITAATTNENHAFATWSEVTATQMQTVVSGGSNALLVDGACPAGSGYVQNPYPPAVSSTGVALSSSVANDLTRPSEPPKRYCVAGNTGGGLYRIWRLPTNPCINQCPGSDEDNRIGVGVTTHNISSGSVNIDWPSTNLGDVAYVSNWTGNEGSLNTTQFAENRTNGLYLLKRRCGADGRWEDPLPMCALNNGVFGAANFRIAGNFGYGNSIRSYTDQEYNSLPSGTTAETSVGVCSIPHSIDATRRAQILATIASIPNAIPTVYCRNPNGNIDETHIARVTGTTDCGICQPLADPTSVNNRISITPESRPYYPRELVSSPRTVCNSADGFYLYNAGGFVSLPSAICDPSGNGVWIAQNANSCGRACNIRNSFLTSQNIGVSDNCIDGGINFAIQSAPVSSGQSVQAAPGEKFEFTGYRSCNLASSTPGGTPQATCSYWRYAAICDDGNLLINQNTGTVNTQCPYSQFNYTSSSWGASSSYGPSPNRYFVAYRHFQRTPSIATGRGMLKIDGNLLDIDVECTNCTSPVRTIGVPSLTPAIVAASTTWITPTLGSGSGSGSGTTSGTGAGGTGTGIMTGTATTPSSGIGLSVTTPGLYSDNNFVATSVTNCGAIDQASSGNSVFNTPVGNYLPNTTISGSCASNAIQDQGQPSITCQPDGTWLLSNDCRIACSVNHGHDNHNIFTIPSNPNDLSRIPGGPSISGDCKPTSTASSSNRPSISCQTDGTWSLANGCGDRSTGPRLVTFRPIYYHNGGRSNLAVTTNSLYSGNMTGGDNGDHRYWVTHYGSFTLNNRTNPRATIVLNVRTIDNRFRIQINGQDVFNTPVDKSLRAANEVPWNRAIAIFPNIHGWSQHFVSPWDPHRGGSRSLPRMRITITPNADGTSTSVRLQGLRYDWMNDQAGQGFEDFTLSHGSTNNTIPFRHGLNTLNVTAYDGARGDHININSIVITEH